MFGNGAKVRPFTIFNFGLPKGQHIVIDKTTKIQTEIVREIAAFK